MKQFRIKQYSGSPIYCIQQRTGIFTWKTFETKTIRQHALNTLNRVNKDSEVFLDYPLVTFGFVNEAFIIIPTIAYHKKSLLIAWLKVGVNINF
jgi:hypothetical protein